jgi:hypothetical protein
MSTKFVKKKAIESKFAPPQGVIDFPYMYLVKLKKSFGKNPKSIELRYLA